MPLNDKKLLQLRMSRSLSQNEVAKNTNISQATLSYMESGKYSDYRISHLESLAKFYGVSLDYLIDYVPDIVTKEKFLLERAKEYAQESLSVINKTILILIEKNSNRL
jgi:transcriptional regulator with XRE-family HTH domain